MKTNRRSFLKGLGAIVPATVAAKVLPAQPMPIAPTTPDYDDPNDDYDRDAVDDEWIRAPTGDTPRLDGGTLTIDHSELIEVSYQYDNNIRLDYAIAQPEPTVQLGVPIGSVTLRTHHDGLMLLLQSLGKVDHSFELVIQGMPDGLEQRFHQVWLAGLSIDARPHHMVEMTADMRVREMTTTLGG